MSSTNADRIASVDKTLSSVIGQLETEATLKKQIRESLEPIEEISRAALTEMNKLHSATSATEQAAICERSLATITKVHPLWQSVADMIPKGEFYSFAIGPICRSFVTAIAFARFILHDELVPAFTAENLMGLGGDASGELQLTADDYLQGVIGMVNELPRLSINAVTAQNFALPVKIASFVNDVFQSYSLLNLRNDQLRRRFDSLKYDLKRCEDVLYDLTLRGLAPTAASGSSS